MAVATVHATIPEKSERSGRSRIATDNSDTARPVDRQARVVAGDAAFGLGSVEGRVQVQQFAVGLEYLEAVRAALGNDQHARVVRRKLLGMPAEEGRRTRPAGRPQRPTPAPFRQRTSFISACGGC